MNGAAITEIDRRVSNVIRVGKVTELDEANALVRVEVGDLVSEWVPWVTGRAGPDRVWHAPEPGEQVVLLSPGGDMAQAVVLTGVYQDAHTAPANLKTKHRIEYADGAFLQYDRAGHHWTLDVPAAGSITLNIGGTTLLLEDGKATLTTPEFLVDSPTTTCTGDLTVQGSVNVTGASVTHGGKNIGKTHIHSGVTTGPSNTGQPV